MKYERRKNRFFDIIKVTFLTDKKVMRKSKIHAKKKHNYTHKNDPSSSSRSKKEIYNAQLLGTVADISCSKILSLYLEDCAEVERYDDIRDDEFKNPDMFDIRIMPEKKKK